MQMKEEVQARSLVTIMSLSALQHSPATQLPRKERTGSQESV